ncbi:helix-turn-helix domain-containing protein [Leptospira kmetyi]|uniref:AraC family transcriptional regulator n=1 Tax=Leptospira kmetyi TaxID=408139 RepID=A0A2M9XMS7_9LEPT|nr:helix-turn-helix domain-containing protein [Leptospira kmetyi]AYV55222.1 AraC family transcriptional regulator [Leptospira kmetyi]PJZ28977.1 AraC family transcriptional regulator [Leptospira kmetyi]PJZ40615.1 AraC family transcriptional regulator [Leptospira kmetyi]TGL70422.1 AraC family transcriptional regulator [Leptospira kmetyi]
MDFFSEWNLLFYLVLLKDTFNRYLEYFYSASVVISFLTGISGLYKAKKDRLNLVRGIFLLSVCFMLLGHGKSFMLITVFSKSNLTFENRLFYSYYYGFAAVATFSSTFYVMHLFGTLKNPLRYSVYSFASFPAIFAISQLFDELISIVYFAKVMLFTLQMWAGLWTSSQVLKNRMKKIYFNYPLQNFVLCGGVFLHSLGMWLESPLIIMTALSLPGFFIVYFFVLEYNHPDFWKVGFSSELMELKPEDLKSQILQTNPKNLVERLDISRIEERIQKFIDDREFLDEEIRLSDFSAYIGLSLHQASYYLNNYKDLSFTDFLSFHRLEEAKRMIQQKPEINLLEVALASGFNSPSSFRRACIKFSGKPPKEFRNHVLMKMSQPIVLDLQNQIGQTADAYP